MRKFLPVALAIIGFLVTVIPGIATWNHYWTVARLRQQAVSYPATLRQAQQNGIPLSMADLQRPLPSSEHNAAPLYTRLKALADAPTHEADDRTLVALSKKDAWTPEEMVAVTDILQRHQDFLTLARQATDRPQCVFRREWGNPDPNAVQFPEYAAIRSAARYLTAGSLLLARQGKPLDAVRNLTPGFRLARHVSGEPGLVSGLLAIAIDAITVKGMEKILYISGGDATVARAVKQSIDREWQPRDLALALKSEAAFQNSGIALIRHQGVEALGKLSEDYEMARVGKALDLLMRLDGGRVDTALIDASHDYMLRQMQKIVAAERKPFPEARREVEAVMRDVEEAANKPLADGLPRAMSGILFPDFSAVLAKKPYGRAMVEAVRAGAAVLAYRGSHSGGLPTGLTGAMSTVPTDPFDEKPLRYRQESGGFVVYSIGPNGDYDGQFQPKTVKKDTGPIIAFRYPPAD